MWRFYSREIEADLLRYYRVDICDWFTGKISTRRVVTLLDGLPDDSLFKTWAVRGGDWGESQYVQARLVNEVALSRADGKGYMPNLVQSPAQLAAAEAEAEFRRQRHAQNLIELEGGDRGDHR